MINIDYTRDSLLTDAGKATIMDRYTLAHEKSPQDAFARAALAYSDNAQMAQRIYDYASKLWFGFSSPVLASAPIRKSYWASSTWATQLNGSMYTNPPKGMPISCFLNHVDNNRGSILDHYTENGWLSSYGGGIGGNWSSVQSSMAALSNGGRSSGAIPFMKVVDSQMLAFHQGSTRRGSYAAYLDISHPEIVEFINMRKPAGGDENRKCLNLHHGVNVTDEFMELVKACVKDADACDDWPLIDPRSNEVVQVISAKKLWQQLLEARMQTGEPYLHFIDTSNRALPQSQKDKGLKIRQSNLCAEITLPTEDGRTAVCCLSSMNAETFDQWHDDHQVISDVVRFLDNVLEFFIRNAPDQMKSAIDSARAERSLGLGLMGLHSYMQSKLIPFESGGVGSASQINGRIMMHINKRAIEATKDLAILRGECADMKGTGRRNSHLMAIAPNATSSVMCGSTSPSIEPWSANVFTHKTLSGSFEVRNKHLAIIIAEKFEHAEVIEEVWADILAHGGSVQQTTWLTEDQKAVFKTAFEIDPLWIVEHAATRQPYICQSQSVNLFIEADADIAQVHDVHYQAWSRGLKSLYYCRSKSVRRAESVSQKVQRISINIDDSACLSCEG